MKMNRMRGGLLVIASCVFLLSACNEHKHLVFTGESENWRVTFEADVIKEKIKENSQTVKNSETTRYTFEYIGDGPIPKRIDYSIFRSGGSTPLNEHGIYQGGSSCSNCAITWEDSEIEASIKWDDQSETIQLEFND